MMPAISNAVSTRGTRFSVGTSVTAIGPDTVVLSCGEQVGADLVVAAVGVRPDTRLAADAGLATGHLGGILVEKSGANVDVAIPVENRPGVFAEVTTLMGSNDINILDLYVRHSNTERAALVLTLDAGDAPEARELLRESGFGAEVQN